MQRIYDSKLQQLVDFVTLEEGKVGMYVCGPTVQSSPHIGHLRSALAYDLMRRWFTAQGKRVTFVRNVTDIDDKILDGAKALQEQGNDEKWWALAYRVEREFTAAYDALGILAPTYEPRATANIMQMQELIKTLIERGHAYQAADGSANVYFDTQSWPEYGALTRQSLEQMEPAADGDPLGKKTSTDFALWKAHKDDEPISASWDSPWGRGRPGWHIECSAMAKRYLGDTFDIHGGGLDLRFPHHENEMAQSNAAGDGFAKHWIHNGLVNTGGQKMSKSLGNSLFAQDLLQSAKPIVLRYFLIQAHYRSVLEYTANSLQEAASAFQRIESVLQRLEPFDETITSLNGEARVEDLPEEFTQAMLDDFGTPEALAVVHGTVTAINTALDAKNESLLVGRESGSAELEVLMKQLVAMLDVLGLDPRAEHWRAGISSEDSKTEQAFETLVEALLTEREEARANKNFVRSDEIRDHLDGAGISIEDHASGTRWSVK